MLKAYFRFWLLVVCVGLSNQASSQEFDWQHLSLGGGGVSMEVRFSPANFMGQTNPALYVATDVSGVYRATGYDADGEVNFWERLAPTSESVEGNIADRYTTALAFTTNFDNSSLSRVIAGSKEGIYIWDGSSWSAASMPKRGDTGMPQMDQEDGRYPWIGVIREVPNHTNFLVAGIGNIRESLIGRNNRSRIRPQFHPTLKRWREDLGIGGAAIFAFQ